ncbi:hypothetical protein OH77DRAFT_643458 [Trametes cingulata]|nr:hypothetical protein OH77DRAFT_643458 [Trametes cingulata]
MSENLPYRGPCPPASRRANPLDARSLMATPAHCRVCQVQREIGRRDRVNMRRAVVYRKNAPYAPCHSVAGPARPGGLEIKIPTCSLAAATPARWALRRGQIFENSGARCDAAVTTLVRLEFRRKLVPIRPAPWEAPRVTAPISLSLFRRACGRELCGGCWLAFRSIFWRAVPSWLSGPWAAGIATCWLGPTDARATLTRTRPLRPPAAPSGRMLDENNAAIYDTQRRYMRRRAAASTGPIRQGRSRTRARARTSAA